MITQLMKRLNLIVLVPVVALISGCASAPEPSPVAQQQALSLAPPAGMGGLYIIRPGGALGAAVPWEVYVDDADTGGLENGRYFYDVLSPGAHTLGEKHGTNFVVEAGRNYFFAMKPGFARPKFQSLSETDGQADVRRLKLSGNNRFEFEEGASNSTVLVKLDFPKSSYPIQSLRVLNLDSKKVMKDWPIDKNGWVAHNAPIGRYLITSFVQTSIGGLSLSAASIEIRCKIEISKPDLAICYGKIIIGNGKVQFVPGIDAAAKDYYEKNVAGRSALVEGELIRELQGGGN